MLPTIACLLLVRGEKKKTMEKVVVCLECIYPMYFRLVYILFV